ncbi:glycosyltransferase family 4 protein [Candidatus Poribacteria bacterium]|nr:glycosyltransferase family 4 protein [Candidatus Poribacteria bacterium]
MDKLESKRKLIQALGNEFLLEKPLIGIVPGLNPRDGKLLLQKLLATNPDLNWLVVDPILERYFKKTGDKRISFFSVLNLQDKEVSPLVFSALDLAIFPAILGSSGTLLLEMAACGIPLIVWGYSKPVEIGDFCLFIHVESSLFDRVTFPIESISENINFLLGNQNEREKLSEGARKLVSSYTWDVTSQQVLDLFRRFNLKRNLHLKDTSSDFPILFSKHYNTAQGKVESHAFEMPYFFQYDIEKGIALTLLGKHTLTEIRALLMHICREQERANQIIEEIAEDMILSDPNCF